jgi:hypothetical protein
MRHLVPVLLLLGVTLGLAARAAEPRSAIPLWKAAKEGKVSVTGRSLGSYTGAAITIQNMTAEEVSVDVNGSYMRPSGDYQRLGFGLLERGSKVTEVTLARHEKTKVNVLSVCMDQSKHSPMESTSFTFVTEEAPGPISSALKHWKDHPKLDQGDVQYEVWGGPQATTHKRVRPVVGPVPVDLPDGTRKVAVVEDTVYALVGPGELLAARKDEEFRSVASDVEDVLALDGTLHVAFRTAPAPVTSGTRERRACIARRESGRWTEELTVAKPGQLAWVTTGHALVVDREELILLNGRPGGPAAARKSVGNAHDLVIPIAEGALILAPGDDRSKLTVVTAEKLAVKWLPAAVRSIAPWEGVLLGATTRGELLRIEGESVKNVQFLLDETQDAVALKSGAVLRRALALRTIPGGTLVETDKGLRSLGKGRSAETFTLPAKDAELFTDGLTVHARSGNQLYRYAGRWESVRFVKIPPATVPEPDDEDAAVATVDSSSR